MYDLTKRIPHECRVWNVTRFDLQIIGRLEYVKISILENLSIREFYGLKICVLENLDVG